MAIGAPAEFVQQRFHVRLGMAIPALRDKTMPVGMAVDTVQFPMFPVRLLELLQDIFVAGTADIVGDIRPEADLQR